jgi:hypothetical protein
MSNTDQIIIVLAHARLSRGFAGSLDQTGYSLAGLRALGNPVIDTGIIKAQFLLLTTCLWIEVTDALDIAAISRATAIAYHNVIKRASFGATACQSN